MDWQEWVGIREKSFPIWQAAGAGMSQLFAVDGEKRVNASVDDEGRAYWVEVRQPRVGIHLIAFEMVIEDANPRINLRIWLNDAFPDIFRKFAEEALFTYGGKSFQRTVGMKPPSGWQNKLPTGLSLTGLWYSVGLGPLGSPLEAQRILRDLFERFSEYVIACHQGKISPEDVSHSEVVGSEAIGLQPWAADELAIVEIQALNLSQTERQALIKARIGQSQYRQGLLERWQRKCSVTGLGQADYLIASHIVPWSACETPGERWSPDNGLLLPPGLDKAFELGVIGFDDRGKVVLSKQGRRGDVQRLLGIQPTDYIPRFHDFPGLKSYLRRHREIHKHSLCEEI